MGVNQRIDARDFIFGIGSFKALSIFVPVNGWLSEQFIMIQGDAAEQLVKHYLWRVLRPMPRERDAAEQLTDHHLWLVLRPKPREGDAAEQLAEHLLWRVLPQKPRESDAAEQLLHSIA